MNRLKKHWPLLPILLVGLWLRYYYVTQIPTEQLFDFQAYLEVARNVAAGRGYTFMGEPMAFQGSFYSLSLGMVFRLVGSDSEAVAKAYNVVLSTLSIGLVYYVLRRLTVKPLTPFAGALLLAVMPQVVAYNNALGTEVMSIFLMLALSALFVSDLPDKVKWPLLGLLAGITALTKPFFLAYPVLVAMYTHLKTKDLKRTLIATLVVFIGLWAVVAPWTIRNYNAFGRWIPVSYNSGFVLYLNNNKHNTHGGWMSLEAIYKTPELQEKIDAHLENGERSVKLASDIELDFKEAAVGWIKQNPVEFLKLGVIRLHSTYFNGTWDLHQWTFNRLQAEHTGDPVALSRNMKLFKAVGDVFLAILSVSGLLFVLFNLKTLLFGLFNKRRYRDALLVPLLHLGFISAVYFVYEGQPRYNQPVIPFLLIAFLLLAEQIDWSAIRGEEA